MKGKQFFLVLLVAVVLMAVASCATFEEQRSTQDTELTAFDNVYLNGEVTVGDLNNMGVVTASRSMTYTLQANGDWVVEMGNYTYSYNALEDEGTEEGTRVVGNLNFAGGGAVRRGAAVAGGAAAGGDSFGGLFGSLFAGLLPTESSDDDSETSSSIPAPRQIALDAVNYDLLQAASNMGAMAVLMPTYSWDRDETITGEEMAIPLLGPSRSIFTRTIEYTVTARAIAVSF